MTSIYILVLVLIFSMIRVHNVARKHSCVILTFIIGLDVSFVVDTSHAFTQTKEETEKEEEER